MATCPCTCSHLALPSCPTRHSQRASRLPVCAASIGAPSAHILDISRRVADGRPLANAVPPTSPDQWSSHPPGCRVGLHPAPGRHLQPVAKSLTARSPDPVLFPKVSDFGRCGHVSSNFRLLAMQPRPNFRASLVRSASRTLCPWPGCSPPAQRPPTASLARLRAWFPRGPSRARSLRHQLQIPTYRLDHWRGLVFPRHQSLQGLRKPAARKRLV